MMMHHTLHMATMGLVVSTVAPALLRVVACVVPRHSKYSLPAFPVFAGFVLLHAASTVFSGNVPPAADAAIPLILLGASMLFWVPVLGTTRHRLCNPLRTLYLYAAIPLLDMAGVGRLAIGDVSGGLAMILGMLPMGVIAVRITWQWIHAEEQQAATVDGAAALPLGDRGW